MRQHDRPGTAYCGGAARTGARALGAACGEEAATCVNGNNLDERVAVDCGEPGAVGREEYDRLRQEAQEQEASTRRELREAEQERADAARQAERELVQAVRRVCRGEAVPGASAEPTGSLAGFGTWTSPVELAPVGVSDLYYVACAEEGAEKVRDCGDYTDAGILAHMWLTRQWERIEVREARTGGIVAARTFWGGRPPAECPSWGGYEDFTGTPPSGQDRWLQQFLG